MDDGRLRGSMVERQSSEPKPYALRATVYTVGFLLVVFGVIPSFFYIGEQYLLVKDAPKLPEDESLFWYYAAVFWRDFRALAGVAIFSMGMAAYIYCSVWLITYGKGPHVEFDHPKEFVCDGPYRWVRNPVVIALIVTAVGMALYLASWGVAVFVLLGMAFAHWQATKIEEPNLTERFGKSYTDYCQRVNRWIPRPPSKD